MFSDGIESLPGGWFINCEEIKNFYDLKDFTVLTPEWETIEISAGIMSAFGYYYNEWENWYHFKILPNGGGTAQEFPWVIDFLKFFNNIFDQIEIFREKRK